MADERSPQQWRRLAWALLGVVVVLALAIGASGRRPVEGEDRVMQLAAQINCVQCTGESVAGSQSDFAVKVRADLRQRVEAGDTDDEIFAYFASKYDDILLNPSSSGLNSLLWVLPVVVVGAAVAGAVVTLRQRRERGARPTADDRRLVAAAVDDWRRGVDRG
jgi:cytochrome c-type biogenesis protein CcmH